MIPSQQRRQAIHRRPRTVAGVTVLLALCTGSSVAALWPVYRTEHFVVLLVATIALASTIAILGSLFRWSAHLVGLAVAASYLLFGVPLAVPSASLFGVFPTAEGIGLLLNGSVTGWKQLVTVTLPVGSFQPLLVPTFIAIMVTHTVSLSIALRTRRRSLGLIGPCVLFLAAIAFGSSAGFLPILNAGVFVALAVIWLIGTRQSRPGLSGSTGSAPISREAATAAVSVVALVLGGGLAQAALAPPDGQRTVLRTAVTQRFNPVDRVSPLSGLRRYHSAPEATAPLLTVRGLPSGERLRLATLSSYDGVVFSVADTTQQSATRSFALVPSRIDRSASPGRRVTVEVAVKGYADVWLPTVGALLSVDFPGRSAQPRGAFYYNEELSTAAVTAKLSRGDRYHLVTVLPLQPAAEQLGSLRPGGTGAVQSLVVPAGLRVTLERFTAALSETLPEPSPGTKLQAALAGLRTEGYLSPSAVNGSPRSRSGHSAHRITELLTGKLMIGDAEQYATTAAIMAQQLGFPARVVVGFDPEITPSQIRSEGPVADAAQSPRSAADPRSGSITLTGTDFSAWIEVETQQFGWVSLATTPPARPVPEPQPEAATEVPRPQTVVPPTINPPAEPPDPASVGGAKSDRSDASHGPTGAEVVLRVLAWILFGVAVAGAPALTIVIAKARRSHLRRRRRPARECAIEAWNDFIDSARDYGYRLPLAATRVEISAVVGAPLSGRLAVWADFSSFAPISPILPNAANATRAPDAMDEPDADRCWRLVAELRRNFYTDLSRWQRLRARISLRSLSPSSGV